MHPKIHERHKQPGVQYAWTDDGVELPVIDITHPAFYLPRPDEQGLAATVRESNQGVERHNRMPAWLRRVFLWWISRRSILLRGLQGSSAGFLSGMNTYLMKLGPDNLGKGYAHPVDKMVAGTATAVSARLRMQDTARLLADGLTPLLAAQAKSPLHFINLASGPCMDSLNALLLLHKENTELLAGRRIYLHAYDVHAQGPHFGNRALEALRAEGAPLHGLDVTLRYIPYDWDETDALRNDLQGLGLDTAVTAASSEGGLLHYGSDAAIRSNLQVLAGVLPKNGILVGSYTRADNPTKAFDSVAALHIISRTYEQIATLAADCGWVIRRQMTQITSGVVMLEKSA